MPRGRIHFRKVVISIISLMMTKMKLFCQHVTVFLDRKNLSILMEMVIGGHLKAALYDPQS